jgi:hypothetical protein
VLGSRSERGTRPGWDDRRPAYAREPACEGQGTERFDRPLCLWDGHFFLHHLPALRTGLPSPSPSGTNFRRGHLYGSTFGRSVSPFRLSRSIVASEKSSRSFQLRNVSYAHDVSWLVNQVAQRDSRRALPARLTDPPFGGSAAAAALWHARGLRLPKSRSWPRRRLPPSPSLRRNKLGGVGFRPTITPRSATNC